MKTDRFGGQPIFFRAAGKPFVPDCFDSEQQFRDWEKAARLSNEVSSICMDCTAIHEAEMKALKRCDKEYWQVKFARTRALNAHKGML